MANTTYARKVGDNGISYVVDSLGKPVSDVPTITTLIKQYGSIASIPLYQQASSQQQVSSSPVVTQQPTSSSTIKVSDTGKSTLTGVTNYLKTLYPGITLLEVEAANPQLQRTGNKLGDWNLIYSTDIINVPSKYLTGSGGGTGSVGGSSDDYSSVTDAKSAEEMVNKDVAKDAEIIKNSDEPTEKKSYTDITSLLSGMGADNAEDTTDILNKKMSAVKEAIVPAEEYPSLDLDAKLTELRTKYGVDSSEAQLNILKTQLAELQTAKQTRTNAERGKSVATNVIEGRVSQVEREENERIAAVENSIKTATDQLNTAYNVINQYMDLADTDYDNSVAKYNTDLQTNLKMIDLIEGVEAEAKSEQKQKEDTARANLQIVYNQLSEGNIKLSDLTSDQQVLITKLEVQAGLPTGFYKTLQSTNPTSEIVTTLKWTSSDDTEYVSVIMKDTKTGALTTKNIALGTSGGTNKTADERKASAISNYSAVFVKGATLQDGTPIIDTNGFITPTAWKAAIASAPSEGLTREQFISEFGYLLYPNGIKDYGLTAAEQKIITGR